MLFERYLKRWTIGFVCAILLVALIATVSLLTLGGRRDVPGAGATPGYKPVPSGYTAPQVAWVGDSWTGGSDMGGRGSQNYSAIVSREFKWRAFNAAQGGTGYIAGGSSYSFGSDDRLARLADAGRFDIIFVVNGFNDYKFQAGDTYEAAKRTFERLGRVLRPGGRLVVIGYVPLENESRNAKSRNAILKRAALDTSATFWNPSGRGWFTGTEFEEHIGRDHYHPTNEGHIYLASRVADLVRSAHLDKVRHVQADSYGPLPGVTRQPVASGSRSRSTSPTPRPAGTADPTSTP